MRSEKRTKSFAGRKILTALVLAFVCIVFCGAFSVNAYAKVHKIKSAKGWHNISKYKGGTFKLTKDIKLTKRSQYLTIKKNKKYTIDLNGHNITTTYSGVALENYSPLVIKKGTVILKNSKKNKKGIFYSTETTAVLVGGKSKFYLKNATVYNNATEFRSNLPTGIYLRDKAKCYLQGNSRVLSIGNAIVMFNNAQLTASGTGRSPYPYIRAGFSNIQGAFTHYGSGINITSPSCKVTLKSGSIGTKASPPAIVNSYFSTIEYQQSGDFPVYDKNGNTLKLAKGYVYLDFNGNVVPMSSSFDYLGASAVYYLKLSGANPDKRLTTTVKDNEGYYTVFVWKK